MSKHFETFARSAGGPIGVAVALLGVAGTVYLLFGDKIKKALEAAGQAVNPTSDKNLAYTGVNAVGAAVTGDKDFSLGSWLYDVTHPNDPYNKAPEFTPRAVAVKEEAAWYERLIGH